MTSGTSPCLRTLLVGLGRIGWSTHLPTLLKHPGFRVTGAVDPAEERLAECRNSFGIPGFRTLEEALEKERFDLAVIASPTCFHAEQTIAALRHGCHVFCDKPAALDSAQFRQMAAAARENRRILTVFQPMRIDRHNLFAREIVRSGKLGKVFLVKLLRTSFAPRNDWQALKSNGGGMLLNYGSHMVDQANYIFGGGGEVLCCVTDRILSLGDADDVVKLLLRYGSVTVDIDINQAAADNTCRFAIYGSRGSAILPGSGSEWRLRLLEGPAGVPAELHSDLSAPGRKYPAAASGFRSETAVPPEAEPPEERYYDNLHRALTAGEALLNPPSDTAALIRMIDRAGEIAEENASR